MCIPDRDNKPVGNGREHTAVGGDKTKQKNCYSTVTSRAFLCLVWINGPAAIEFSNASVILYILHHIHILHII